MFAWLKTRKNVQRNARQLYECIVLQARQPDFYRRIGVLDSLEGRFEMIVLHLFLVLDRLSTFRPASEDLARTLSETFVTDMDDCMRELGVGDTSVPKKVKRAAIALRERSTAYKNAMQAGRGELAEALRACSGSLEEQQLSEDASVKLADYVLACQDTLAQQDYSADPVPTPEFADIRAF